MNHDDRHAYPSSIRVPLLLRALHPYVVRSALGVGLSGLALEFERHERLVAEHPCVMPRVDPVRVARTKIELAAVGGRDVQPAGDDVPEVCRLAALPADHGLDALRPPPSRLRLQPRYRGPPKVDNAHSGLFRAACLVGAVHALGLDAGHACAPLVRVPPAGCGRSSPAATPRKGQPAQLPANRSARAGPATSMLRSLRNHGARRYSDPCNASDSRPDHQARFEAAVSSGRAAASLGSHSDSARPDNRKKLRWMLVGGCAGPGVAANHSPYIRAVVGRALPRPPA